MRVDGDKHAGGDEVSTGTSVFNISDFWAAGSKAGGLERGARLFRKYREYASIARTGVDARKKTPTLHTKLSARNPDDELPLTNAAFLPIEGPIQQTLSRWKIR